MATDDWTPLPPGEACEPGTPTDDNGCVPISNCTDSNGNPVPIVVTLDIADPDGDGIINVEISGDVIVPKFATWQGTVCTAEGDVQIVFCIEQGITRLLGYVDTQGIYHEGERPEAIPCEEPPTANFIPECRGGLLWVVNYEAAEDGTPTEIGATNTGEPCGDCSIYEETLPCEDDPSCYQKVHDPCLLEAMQQVVMALTGECPTEGGEPVDSCCVNSIDLTYIEDPDNPGETLLQVTVTNTAGEDFSDTVPVPSADCDFSGLPAADCLTVNGIVTSDCEIVSPDDLAPAHSIGQCCQEGETLAPVGGATSDVITALSATELDRGQVGSRNINPSPSAARPNIPPNTFPLTIPIPASNPDCVLALQVTWGGQGPDGSLGGPSVVAGAGSDYSAPQFVNETGVNSAVNIPYRNGTAMWMFDPNTGNAGSDVVLDFSQKILETAAGDIEGVCHWMWTEICDAGGAIPLAVADFDIAGLQEAEVGAYSAPNTPESAASAIDLGDCAGFYFAAARHVDESGPGASEGLNVDSDWFNPNNTDIVETYDITTHQNDSSCQMGSALGIVPGGTGPWTYSATPNGASAVTLISAPNSSLTAVALKQCETGPGAGDPEESATCEIELVNPNCLQDGVMRCWLRGAVTLTAEPGDHIQATPNIGGVLMGDQVAAIDNTNGTSPVTQTFPVSVMVTDLGTIIPPNGTATGTFSWVVEAFANGGNAEATISDWESECEIIHVG